MLTEVQNWAGDQRELSIFITFFKSDSKYTWKINNKEERDSNMTVK